MNTPYFLPFDLFQQVVIWLSVSTRSHRKGRHYLEENPVLLQVETDKELERLITAYAEDQEEMEQQMCDHLEVLRDARQRGGSITAIREAYVNRFGSFTLDLPTWLAEVEQQHHFFCRLHRPDRTYKAHAKLLQSALVRALQDPATGPEANAELQNEIGRLLTQSLQYMPQQERRAACETAIVHHKAALSIFRKRRYPLQYAKTCTYLGQAYQYHSTIEHRHMQEQYAISCFEAALRIYTQHCCPEHCALLKTTLGNIYAQRGEQEEQLMFALAYHQAALQEISQQTSPEIWATIQIHLGDVYLILSSKGAGHYREQARSCYRAALQVYTIQDYPRKWADIHLRMAAIFQAHAEAAEEEGQRDLYLRCAIVCYEGALQYYSPEADPVEYATAQFQLEQLQQRYTEGQKSVEQRNLYGL